MPGGSYNNGVNGFDHVFEKLDETGQKIVMIVDSKQIKNGGFKLSQVASGSVQLDSGWISQVMGNIDPTSAAYKAIEQAQVTGNLRTAVAGFDAVSDEYKFIQVAFNSVVEAID